MMVNLFRGTMFTAWLLSIGTTIAAAQAIGFDSLMPFFTEGFSHPWGMAINVDFSFHLLLVSLWLIWSARNLGLGLIYGLVAFMLGGSFTFAYLLVQSFLTKGDFKAMLLGRNK